MPKQICQCLLQPLVVFAVVGNPLLLPDVFQELVELVEVGQEWGSDGDVRGQGVQGFKGSRVQGVQGVQGFERARGQELYFSPTFSLDLISLMRFMMPAESLRLSLYNSWYSSGVR